MTFATIHEAALLLVCSLLLLAILWDVALRTIPNTLCAALAIVALASRAQDGNLLGALIAGLAVFLGAAFCWRRGWLGGGDVKLLAASVLLVSPGNVPSLLEFIAIAGGALAGCYLVLSKILPTPRGRPSSRTILRVIRAERWRISRRVSLPYACAISAGAFLMLLKG